MTFMDLVSWQTLSGQYIARDVPFEMALGEAAGLTITYDPGPSRLGMRLRLNPGRTWSRAENLRNITMRSVLLGGERYAEISTDSRELFRAIYALIGDVQSRVRDGEADPLSALALSLDDFEALVARSGQLSKGEAVGLLGELHVLQLLLAHSVADVDCWTGPNRDAHDFRLGSAELEVKTTLSNTRVHEVHGLNQLSPSPGKTLSLLSIRLASAGSGEGVSVDGLVAYITGLLTKDAGALGKFRQALSAARYGEGQPECAVRYRMAAPVMAIAVGPHFPVLGYEWLSQVLGDEAGSRIRNVDMTVDLEGLGQEFDLLRLGNVAP